MTTITLTIKTFLDVDSIPYYTAINSDNLVFAASTNKKEIEIFITDGATGNLNRFHFSNGEQPTFDAFKTMMQN